MGDVIAVAVSIINQHYNSANIYPSTWVHFNRKDHNEPEVVLFNSIGNKNWNY